MSTRITRSRAAAVAAVAAAARGRKKSATTPSAKTQARNDLLATILKNCVTMPSCSACEERGIETCQVSPRDSGRCTECVRLGMSHCDVLGPDPAIIRKMTREHRKLEDELEMAEEQANLMNAKIRRLREQKRMWSRKLARAIRRGLDSVEELDRVEREEAAERARQAGVATGTLPPAGLLPETIPESMFQDINAVDWSSFIAEAAETVRSESAGPSGS